MKSGSWRFLLICLMLVLLPLQGFAATGMWAFVHGNSTQTASGAETNDTVSRPEHCDTMKQSQQVSAQDAHSEARYPESLQRGVTLLHWHRLTTAASGSMLFTRHDHGVSA
jgi:hypothetical protein